MVTDRDMTTYEVAAAMEGHILAEGETVGTYTLNPDPQPKKTCK